MNLSRCEQGHFYDKEKYATCPHCSGGSASDESLTTVYTEDATAPLTAPMAAAAPMAPLTPGFSDTTEAASPLPIAGIPVDQATVALDDANYDTPTVPLVNNNGNIFDNVAVTEAADDDDDHTVGFFDDDIFGAPAASQTPSQPAVNNITNKVSTPCVGWLIALGGEHIGTDFRLKVGKNFIGRGAQMDVALTDDKSVSRDRHAIVVYEPKAHLYLVQPGESSSLVYKNNEVVLSPVELKAYDMITVGDINLLFMPLCGERFNWSDLLEEMKKNK